MVASIASLYFPFHFSSPSSSSRVLHRQRIQALAATIRPVAASTSAASQLHIEDSPKQAMSFLSTVPYSPPDWAISLAPVPSRKLCLAHTPTPIHRWLVPGIPDDVHLFIKRDDMTGMELSGNKVRKLEFLLADALDKGADTVVTIGGIQSNHCRATTVAARLLGLDTHLVLRTSQALVNDDPGLVGNLLVERLAGAVVHLVSKQEYGQYGSPRLGELMEQQLQAQGLKPYVIPVGGSNALGTWGYLDSVREIESQLASGQAGGATGFDEIAFSCGSGGTAAGLALGVHLSSLTAKVHAFGVCDSPDYFYDYIQGLLDGMVPSGGPQAVNSREIIQVTDVKGRGYAISSDEELKFVQKVAAATGIVLDPVYSGKAALGLFKAITASPEVWRGRRILFIHTGGLLGMYDKLSQLQPLAGEWRRMELPES